MRGILAEVVQVGFWAFLLLGTLPYMMKLNTLGTVQYEDKFDPLTLTKTVNDYDNSLLILLIGIIGLVAILLRNLPYDESQGGCECAGEGEEGWKGTDFSGGPEESDQ